MTPREPTDQHPPTRAAFVLLFASLLLWPPALQGQGFPTALPKSVEARSIQEGQLSIDGRLSEIEWQRAQVATGFVQRDPDDGSPATERTEVRVLYSDVAIYVAVRSFDSNPDEIRSRLARRDQVSQSDEVAIFFDSYHDRRSSFEFAVTPTGSIRDVFRPNDRFGGRDATWDPVWEVETSIDDLGWVAEFRIPFTQLRFDKEGSTWGFQVFRRIQRRAENVWWSPRSKEGSGFASRFGLLEGLEGLPSPMRLEVRPYAVASGRFRPEGTGSVYQPSRKSNASAGLDLKYGLTSDFTLDVTFNPDFGQVEADPSVVNLTAFETFFPERRPFFVEGSGLFNREVAGGSLFYSRRVGRRPQGYASAPDGGTTERPDASTILSAAKVTGKSGAGLAIGVLSAITSAESAVLRDSLGAVVGDAPVEPLAHYFAARVEQDFDSGNHTVGGMVTALNRRLDGNFDFLRSAAYAVEIDGRHRWKNNTYSLSWNAAGSFIKGSSEAIVRAQRSSFRYYQRPDADHVQLDSTRTTLSGASVSIFFSKDTGRWRYSASASRVTPGFEVGDLGFQAPVDRQIVYGGFSFNQNRPRGMFRRARVGILDFTGTWTTAGERTRIWFRPVRLSGVFKNNWSFSVNPLALNVGRRSTTALRGGTSLRQNAYRRSYVNVATDRRKSVSLRLGLVLGGTFDTPSHWGTVTPSVRVRPNDVTSIDLYLNYDWRHDPIQWVGRREVEDSTRYILGEIDRETLELTTRVDWTMSPTLSLQFYAQPFVSAGRYEAFRDVVDPNASSFDDRFRLYGDELACTDGSCEVDVDGDGSEDFSFGQPDFNVKQLRATAVLRWEYRPGSVVFLAWQHGRSDRTSDGSFGGFGDMGDLVSLDSDNTLLVKINYWLGF